MDEKRETRTTSTIEAANAVAVNEKNGTRRDELDMDRMGKVQELRVRLCKQTALCFEGRK